MGRELPANVRQRGSKYRGVVVDASTRRRKYGPLCATVEEAAAWVAEQRRQAAYPKHTLGQAWDDLVIHWMPGWRDGTFGHYAQMRKSLRRHLPETMRVADVTPDVIRSYVTTKLAEGVSMSSLQGHELPALRRVIRWAIQMGAGCIDPFGLVRLPRVRAKRFTAFTADELRHILGRIRASGMPRAEEDADWIELLATTGLRRAELARLRVEDVDLPNRMLFVDGKTASAYLPIAEAQLPMWGRMLERAHKDGRLVTAPYSIAACTMRWKRRLNEPRLKPHSLRHTFATNLARQGVSPYVLRDLMRHATLKQTSRYLHAQPDRAAAALEQLAASIKGNGQAS